MEMNSGVKNRANASIKEVICRSLFTLTTLMLASSLVAYVQTQYQLASPLIPDHVVDQIAGPGLKGALPIAILLIPSLWFYFYRKLIVVMVLQGLSLVGFVVMHYV